MKTPDEKLREIIGKAEKATHGSWINSVMSEFKGTHGIGFFCHAIAPTHQNIHDENIPEDELLNRARADAEFISSANPDAVKSICQELIEARAALKFYAKGAGIDVVDEEQNYSTHNVVYKNDFLENGKMDLKKIMNSRDLKQRDLVKGVNVDTSRISMQINGVRPLPKKYHDAFCKLIGITKEQLENFNKKGGNHGI